jgi:hypothetical protein
MKGYTEVVKLLVDAGADANKPDAVSYTLTAINSLTMYIVILFQVVCINAMNTYTLKM